MHSRAIVLRTIRYSDEALIARLLTEEQGCVSMQIRISRSRRASVRHTLFRPLAVLDVEWNDRPKAELQRPKAVQTALTLRSLPYEASKAAIALFLAEFLEHAVRTESDCRTVFEFTVRSVEWLDTCLRGFANFHLVFLLRLTRFLGFQPDDRGFCPGAFFDLRGACFVRTQPLHPDFLAPAEAALLPQILRMRYANMHLFRFSGAQRSQLLARLNDYYRLHLPSFPELKSLDILRQTF